MPASRYAKRSQVVELVVYMNVPTSSGTLWVSAEEVPDAFGTDAYIPFTLQQMIPARLVQHSQHGFWREM